MSSRGRIASTWKYLFGDSAKAFGTLSLALLVLLAIVPARDYFREWLGFQKQYLRLISRRSDAASLGRRFQSGLQQVWLPEIGVVDRCTTCHVGLKEASLVDVKAQPFRPHPQTPHSLTEFGCVLCHRGQGTATTVEEAHSSTKSWEEPILPARYLESACGQCHLKLLTGTPRLNQGRRLLAQYGCVRCHTIKTPEGVTMTGADDPPSLEHIGEKTTREWIAAWLKNPQAYAGSATMPNFQLPDEDIRDISAFLIAQSTPYKTEKPLGAATAPSQDDAAVQQGSSLYGESFCASCHAMQNAAGILVGGNLGPELTRVGSKVKTDWLADWLRNPSVYDRDTAMPHYRLDSKQITLLLGFLGSKADSDFIGNTHLDTATPAQIEHGKTVVLERGCAACHEINGVKRPDNFAPELTLVGSRPLAKILFAPGVAHTLPDYIAAKIRQPRSFGNALKMPQFTLADQQVDALVTALLAQTGRAQTLPATLRVPARRPTDYHPAGRAGQLIEDMRCFSCHSINGRGGDMAPDLTWEGTSVRRAWLVDFLKNPNTLRPALIRRMPKFNVTDAEANTLADYIMTVYQTPEFDGDAIDASRFTATEVQSGKELFYGKYACQSCHIVDSKNDKGYIGPTLTQVGTRLSAAWMFHWLKNAQSLRPGTQEPVWKMNDEDARAITAFLAAQQGAPGRKAAP
ncbi:MAG TPA: c-type cytochrome [Bryobacteraceae bacterium]|nr:c-type cytochrome [Bryobacteraceae bacterium]